MYEILTNESVKKKNHGYRDEPFYYNSSGNYRIVKMNTSAACVCLLFKNECLLCSVIRFLESDNLKRSHHRTREKLMSLRCFH